MKGVGSGSRSQKTQLLSLADVDRAQLVVIRGLPGSGKTTLAKEIARLGFMHFETDHWFESEAGYVHNEVDLAKAHAWCLRSVSSALASGNRAVVSNVSHLAHHVQLYVDLAEHVVVIELLSNYGSTHNVPAEKVDAMKASWQAFPGAIVV